ncbi:MAG TPA: anti-sigma factor [Candidatus Eremiobacteraceae bacterium]|nr:anti-sigma factor [Candidatus Eremiobacteraceae bacterium]
MNCVELRQSLAEVENGSTAEQSAHLRTCPACSALVTELSLIIAAAGRLQGADEPSPRVWNSIEIALRHEGLIRPQRAARPLIPSFSARWGAARWLVPAAALVLLAVGIFLRQQSQPEELTKTASATIPAASQSDLTQSDLNDEDLMQEVSANAPAMKTQYQENLQRVNESIRDAQGLVDESPNDQDARRSLMDAYQQKSMLFEMAMDRSLP